MTMPPLTSPQFEPALNQKMGSIQNLKLKDVPGILGVDKGGTAADLSKTGGASQYLKQATIGGPVTVGTIPPVDIPGTLDASIITTGLLALARGGTHADLSATGGTSRVLKQVSAGADITVGQLAFTDISGTAVAGQVPNLDASKITTGLLALARGGTNADLSATGGGSQVLKQLTVGGAITVAQLGTTEIPNLDASKITTGQLALARGGTNADLSATGGATQVLKQSSIGAAITVGQLAFTDISGTATNAQVPATLSSKTLDNTNTINVKDTLLRVQDDGDTTKQLAFQCSSIATATTRTVTIPNADTTLPVATQVLTFTGPTAGRTITLPDAAFTVARTDAANSFTGDQTLATGALIISTAAKGVTEKGRAFQMGDWTTFTPTRTASTGTWTVGTDVTARYTLVGQMMTVVYYNSAGSVSATPVNLQLLIPGGFTCAHDSLEPLTISDNGTAKTGTKRVVAADTHIYLYTGPFASGTWATATTNTALAFTFIFEVS